MFKGVFATYWWILYRFKHFNSTFQQTESSHVSNLCYKYKIYCPCTGYSVLVKRQTCLQEELKFFLEREGQIFLMFSAAKASEINFLKVLRFSFPVPVVGLSAKALALSFAFTAENKKSLSLALRAGDKIEIDLQASLRAKQQPAQQAVPCCFGAKKDRGTRFSVLAAREMKRELKNERGGRGSVSFLPSPPPPRLLVPFFAWSLLPGL